MKCAPLLRCVILTPCHFRCSSHPRRREQLSTIRAEICNFGEESLQTHCERHCFIIVSISVLVMKQANVTKSPE